MNNLTKTSLLLSISFLASLHAMQEDVIVALSTDEATLEIDDRGNIYFRGSE